MPGDELYQRGMMAYRQGRGEEARDIFERVANFNPTHAGALKALERLDKVYGEREPAWLRPDVPDTSYDKAWLATRPPITSITHPSGSSFLDQYYGNIGVSAGVGGGYYPPTKDKGRPGRGIDLFMAAHPILAKIYDPFASLAHNTNNFPSNFVRNIRGGGTKVAAKTEPKSVIKSSLKGYEYEREQRLMDDYYGPREVR